MKRVLRYGLILMLLLVGSAYPLGRKEAPSKKEDGAASPSMLRQGISGRVEIWEGDFMPIVDPSRSGGKVIPGAGRRVRIYEPVHIGGGDALALRDSISEPLVAETVCDSTGHFSLSVEPGNYSIFAEEGDGWYYNGFDGSGIQGGVTVAPDSISEVVIKITRKATF